MKYPALNPLLKKMLEAGASDLFLSVGTMPHLRVEDKLVSLEMPSVGQDDIEVILHEVLDRKQLEQFLNTMEADIAIVDDNNERFRVNVHKQMHKPGMVIRHIKSQIPTVEELGLSNIYTNAISERRGLVLLVGSSGAGKSTSMTAMLEYRNNNGSGHIITIEDPIEYVFENKGCIFTQREIGIDTFSFGSALKNALRQSPDVIAIGEIRDRKILESALLFSEAGHLVVATLHANNTVQAIERIINFFPQEQQNQLPLILSQNLKAIFSQRLVEASCGGRVLASEILLNEGLVKDLIAEGKFKKLLQALENSTRTGMRTFDQCLFNMYDEGIINSEVAIREADNPNNIRLRISKGNVSLSTPNMISGVPSFGDDGDSSSGF